MTFDLPSTLLIANKQVPIRCNYRSALGIITGLSDPDLEPADKVELVLRVLYKEPIRRADMEEALKAAYWFLDGGNSYSSNKKSPMLIDWEKDFPIIVAPVNRVIGHDIRADKNLHWWTFLAAYMEIGGDCLFSQVVNIRDKKARNEKLEPYERKWAKRNAELIDLPDRYSQQDNDTLAALGIKRIGKG